MITISHSFTSSVLTSIMAFGSSSSMSLSRRYLISPHLRYRIGSTSTYILKEYSVEYVSDMIQDNKRE